MRTVLRFDDAAVTAPGADGGLDVRAREAGAQVKFYSNPVGIADVQRLKGTVRLGQYAVFYASSSGYTQAARRFSDEAGVALFIYSGNGAVIGVNPQATALLKVRQNIPAPLPPNPDLTPEEREALLVRFNETFTISHAYMQEAHTLIVGRHEQMMVVRRLLEAARTPRRYDQVWARYLPWMRDFEAAEFENARSALSNAWENKELTSEGLQQDPATITRRQEEILAVIPRFLDNLYSAVPLERSEAELWREYWYEHWSYDGEYCDKWPEDIEMCSCGESLKDGTHPFLRSDLELVERVPRKPGIGKVLWPPRPGGEPADAT